MAQLAQRLGFNLANPLPGDIEFLAYFLQRAAALSITVGSKSDIIYPPESDWSSITRKLCMLPQRLKKGTLFCYINYAIIPSGSNKSW
jgi:hypothetical protein